MARQQANRRLPLKRAVGWLAGVALFTGACGGDDAAAPTEPPPPTTAVRIEATTTTAVVATASSQPEAATAPTEEPATSTAPVADEAPQETAVADDDESDEGETQGLVANFVEFDGVQYATSIRTCFATPGKELEVLSVVRESADSDTYAFVVTDDQSPTGFALSEFRVSDPANGLEWRTGGQDATDVVLDGKRIAATVTVESPDGATAAARFDFTCPG